MKKTLIFLLFLSFSSIIFSGEAEDLNWYQKWKKQKYMTGNWGGVRDYLFDHGVEPGFSFTNVVGKVFYGGRKKGRSYPFLLKFGVALHSEGFGFWKGATLFAGGEWRDSFYGNESFTTDYAGSFMTLNDLDDTEQYVQLGEYWFRQTFLDNTLGFKIGRHYPSDHFLKQKVAGEFVNSAFRFLPTVPMSRYRTRDEHFSAYENSPVRKQVAPSIGFTTWWKISDNWKVTLGAFDQRPEPETPWFSEISKKRKNVSVISELLYTPEFKLNRKVKGEYRLGIWYVNKTDYSDKKDEDIHPHAKMFNGTGGPYVTIDQMIFKENADSSDEQGLSLFGQFGFAPGRWAVMLYYGGGILYRGAVPGRDMDTTGFAFGISDFSEKMEGEKDSETGEYIKTFDMKSLETVVEWMYKIQAGNWLTVHHGLQWVRVPKGITDRHNKYYSKDAFIFNVRGEFIF